MTAMKLISLAFVLVIAEGADATMTPHYSTYTNMVYNSNQTVTFTATLQGNSTSDSGGCPSGDHFYHAPAVFVNGTGGGGLTVAPCAYINLNQSVVLSGSCLTNGVGCSVTWNASVYCSFMNSEIFATSIFNFSFGLAYTKSKWNGTDVQYPDGSVQCNVGDWCTAATSPPRCSVATVLQEPLILGGKATCSSYYTTNWFWEQPSGGFTFCFPMFPGQNGTGTTDSSLYSCTK